MKRYVAGPVVLVLILLAAAEPSPGQSRKASDPKAKGDAAASEKTLRKTDEEWARILTQEQFLVTRRKYTEPPFTGKYVGYHGKTGTFACVCCDTPLFEARTKFDSGTGWPSFYKPVAEDHIERELDYSAGTQRVEVTCSACGAHLGHVFDDGPPPTGLRYCINSAALKLTKTAAAPKAKAKSTTKANAKPGAKPKGKPAADESTP